MKINGRHIDPLILVLCFFWVGILGGLGFSAIVEESITTSSKVGITHSEGIAAVLEGLLILGFALLGVLPFLEGSRFRKLWMFFIAFTWFTGSCVYVAFIR